MIHHYFILPWVSPLTFVPTAWNGPCLIVAEPYQPTAAVISDGSSLDDLFVSLPTRRLERFRYRQRFTEPYEAIVYVDPFDERLSAGIELVQLAGRMLGKVKEWCQS